MARKNRKKDIRAPSTKSSGPGPSQKQELTGRVTLMLLVQVSIIVLASLCIYWPAMHGHWIWDDDVYVRQNPLLHDPQRLWKIWFEPGRLVEYYPLEQSVIWLQWQAWQGDPFGYHLTNLALHVINALLVWRLLGKLGLHFAWLGGLLFAIHPLQVESVAWIAELKNTLSMAPFLLALCSWVEFENRERKADYWWAFGFFFVAMLCKVSMAPLPVALLLYAWWRRGKIAAADLKHVAPFFALSLALGGLTYWSGQIYAQHQFIQPLEVPLLDLKQKLSCVGQALNFYFAHALIPVIPLPIYPLWSVDGHSLLQFAPWVILMVVVPLLWTRRNDWGRHAFLGLGFFVLFLLPFAGFFPVSYMKFSWVMDHFVYIPIVGLIGLFVAAVERLDPLLSPSSRKAAAIALAVSLASLAAISHSYAAKYQSLETLFSYALQYQPASWMANQNMGVVRNEQKRFDEAIAYFTKAAAINPRIVLTRINLARALNNAGRYDEEEIQYQEALRIWPKSIDAQLGLGDLLLGLGQTDKAIAHFQTSIQINPESSLLHLKLGDAFFQAGRFAEAIDQYQSAAEFDPSSALLHFNWGKSLRQLNRLQDAADQYELAIRLNPRYVDAHNNLGVVFYLLGNSSEAAREYEECLRINPGCIEAQNNLKSLRGY